MVIGWVKSQRMLLQAGVQAVDMFVVRLSPCRLRREKRARQELELARDEHGFVNKSRDLETKGKGKDGRKVVHGDMALGLIQAISLRIKVIVLLADCEWKERWLDTADVGGE
ncbi:hypothetical protein AXG93_2079s1050 [Marchantia polymorpha subsp. ruderalis]|uniref:Uncharacterized protein n=1 Tax=Marchantia polymorpha subsp. ruderalis TaxID=1480154 RepID=A0A176VSF4_MARPO|nr:hypothetical protein AXG93_2079s1050 [Marchantia polymorpha subsp. ruderalis]